MLSVSWRFATKFVLVCVGLLGISLPAVAQPAPQVPASRQQITMSFAPLVKQVAPAVVNIYTRTVVQSRGQAQSPLFDDPFFRRFFENTPLGQPRQRVQSSLGSGVIVDPSGLIVTNFHVVKGSTEITVVLADRREFEAHVELADERTDLAVLRIDVGGERLTSVHIRDSDDLEVGDLVLAIGNPFGVGQTVTSGIISALARTTVGISDYRFFIQTDAAINPGNSGGALVTMDGGLVGINSAIYSRSGGSIGIGFAVPSNMVRAVLAGVGAGKRLVRPWFGAGGQTVTSELAANLGLPRPEGVLINNIYPNGPAARGGLRQGDIVTEINGRDVDDPEALRFRIATLAIGGQAKLSVLRRGQRVNLTLPLEPPPETPKREETQLQGSQPFAGATVANLSPALADELSLGSELTGVTVLRVARGSPAARVGLQARDILLSLNGAEVDSVAKLGQLLSRPAADKRWRIAIKRGDKVFNAVVE